MIRKLRLKFVAVCMALVTCVLAVVFLSMYTASQRGIERTSRELLERVLTQTSSPNLDQNGGLSIGGGHVQLPYFTVEVWPGAGDMQTIYVTGGTYANLQDSETLRAILTACFEQDATEGTVANYDLRYLRQENGFFQRIAFVDMSMEQATLRGMMRSYMQIGVASLFLLLGISMGLAWWATRPVEAAWRAQRQFLSDASHELKTPLTVILSNAELLDSAQLPPRAQRWADNIHCEGRRMKNLVEEMLTLARADNMVRTAVFTSVCLSEIAEHCALRFEPVAFEAGKTLSYQITPDVYVSGDAEKLADLLSILLDNAIKYGRNESVITLTLEKTDRQARLTVRNENAGDPIPPEQLSRLFERFYRADASRGEQSGFGLGLPIAAAIAGEHKGVLRSESDADSTRFFFTIALRK